MPLIFVDRSYVLKNFNLRELVSWQPAMQITINGCRYGPSIVVCNKPNLSASCVCDCTACMHVSNRTLGMRRARSTVTSGEHCHWCDISHLVVINIRKYWMNTECIVRFLLSNSYNASGSNDQGTWDVSKYGIHTYHTYLPVIGTCFCMEVREVAGILSICVNFTVFSLVMAYNNTKSVCHIWMSY